MNMRVQIASLEKRTFRLLLGGGFVLLLAALVSIVLVPQVRAHKAATKAQSELPQLIVDEQQMQLMLTQRDATVRERSQQLHGDMANLPVREIESFVIDRLQGIAWKNNVVLQSVQPSTSESIDAFREIIFRLELSGHYVDLFSWLSELRDELGFIVIKDYQMTHGSDTGDNPLLDLQLTLASYRKEGAS